MDALPAFEAQIDFFGRSGYPRLRRWRMRGIIVSVTKQMNELAASEAPDPNAIKTLKKWVKKILRLYWFDHYFRGESDLWLYEPFYPRLTQCYVYATAIRKKLFRRNTDT